MKAKLLLGAVMFLVSMACMSVRLLNLSFVFIVETLLVLGLSYLCISWMRKKNWLQGVVFEPLVLVFGYMLYPFVLSVIFPEELSGFALSVYVLNSCLILLLYINLVIRKLSVTKNVFALTLVLGLLGFVSVGHARTFKHYYHESGDYDSFLSDIQSGQNEAGVLKLISDKYDLESVRYLKGAGDSIYTISSYLGNQGDVPITISKIESSCGCLSAMQSRMIIPAHTVVPLEIKLNLNKVNGTFERMLYITSDAANDTEGIMIGGKVGLF